VTTPIENKLQRDTSDWVPDYLKAMEEIRKGRGRTTLVDYHKARLGRQNRTFFNGEFRFWVWEMGVWTVYVSNRKGVCFEVPEMASKRSSLESWEDYKERMGVT